MTVLDPADLVVIAGRTLGIGTDDALARMDIGAAQDALAEARPAGQAAGQARSTGFPDRAAAAAAAVGLVRALLRHRPFPEHGQQVAVAAGLQFLSLNGWRADLNPAGAAAVVVEALASGRLTPHDAAAWLSPRLSPVRRAGQAPITVPRPSLRLPVSLPTVRVPVVRVPVVRVPVVRVPVGRAVAGALLAVAVTGVSLLAAACSRGPAMLPSHAAPARAGSVSAVQQSSRSRMASGSRAVPPADTAYAACIRSHGVESFPSPSAGGVTVIAPAAGIDLESPRFRSAESVCRVTVPTAMVHIVEVGQPYQAGDAKLRPPLPTLPFLTNTLILPLPFLFSGRAEFRNLRDARCPHLWPASSGIDPAKVRLAVELRQRVEERAGLRVGGERGGDVLGQVGALRTLRRQFDGHRVADHEPQAERPRRTKGERPSAAGRRRKCHADPPAVDRAIYMVHGLGAPHLVRVKRNHDHRAVAGTGSDRDGEPLSAHAPHPGTTKAGCRVPVLRALTWQPSRR